MLSIIIVSFLLPDMPVDLKDLSKSSPMVVSSLLDYLNLSTPALEALLRSKVNVTRVRINSYLMLFQWILLFMCYCVLPMRFKGYYVIYEIVCDNAFYTTKLSCKRKSSTYQ